jgi:hypothetical protein
MTTNTKRRLAVIENSASIFPSHCDEATRAALRLLTDDELKAIDHAYASGGVTAETVAVIVKLEQLKAARAAK